MVSQSTDHRNNSTSRAYLSPLYICGTSRKLECLEEIVSDLSVDWSEAVEPITGELGNRFKGFS